MGKPSTKSFVVDEAAIVAICQESFFGSRNIANFTGRGALRQVVLVIIKKNKVEHVTDTWRKSLPNKFIAERFTRYVCHDKKGMLTEEQFRHADCVRYDIHMRSQPLGNGHVLAVAEDTPTQRGRWALFSRAKGYLDRLPVADAPVVANSLRRALDLALSPALVYAAIYADHHSCKHELLADFKERVTDPPLTFVDEHVALDLLYAPVCTPCQQRAVTSTAAGRHVASGESSSAGSSVVRPIDEPSRTRAQKRPRFESTGSESPGRDDDARAESPPVNMEE
ncbi:hypothetical protein BC828DRAFT_394532 [Blastocladiella britannica]|nr:hypothetical protein BC828DRAFT_394532 [Blastocladiella britannica]